MISFFFGTRGRLAADFWRLWLASVVLAAFGCISPAHAVDAKPQAGQTLAEFQKAVTAELAEHHDRMGYAVLPCPLTPPLGPGTETYVARAFSERTDTVIVVIAVERGKVSRWQEFDLPNLEGWITHMGWSCKGSILTVGTGRYAQRFRWNTQGFRKLN